MTLYEMTNHEAGIVVCGDNVIVCNWTQAGDNQLPLAASFIGLFFWDSGDITPISTKRVDDIRDELPGTMVLDEEAAEIRAEGMDILADYNEDIPALWGYEVSGYYNATVNRDENGNLVPTSGTVYELDACVVIAPDGWN